MSDTAKPPLSIVPPESHPPSSGESSWLSCGLCGEEIYRWESWIRFTYAPHPDEDTYGHLHCFDDLLQSLELTWIDDQLLTPPY
jgi:hypothetical protein